MRLQGKITRWNDGKGFGFITWHGDDSTVFVHISAFTQKYCRPEIGEIVSYKLGSDKNGRPRAEQVRFTGQKQKPATSAKRETLQPLILTALFLAVVFLAACIDRISWLIVIAYCIASSVTYIVYAADKSAARTGKWRTPESQLHLCSLIFGWPGALAAQRWLRHKSSKEEFLFAFWFTVLLNVSLVSYMLFVGENGALNRMLNGLLTSVF